MYEPPEDTESDSEDELDNVEVTFTDVAQALSSESDGQFTLPPHLSCASHMLNLVSRNDVEKWLTTKSEFKTIYRSVIGKCSGLWTKASRLTLASELVEDVKLIVPTATRWNSFHDALSRISDSTYILEHPLQSNGDKMHHRKGVLFPEGILRNTEAPRHCLGYLTR